MPSKAYILKPTIRQSKYLLLVLLPDNPKVAYDGLMGEIVA